MSENLVCPVCQSAVNWGDKACTCTNGHSFDLAKEGYANLLLSHQRRSKNPGDNANMVQARRRFLDSGTYSPLSDVVQDEVRSLCVNEPSMLDAGCGEGCFLAGLQQAVGGSSVGIDVSKEAIRAAARRYKQCRWIVANAMRGIPFADASLDVILSVLAPRNTDEFARILKPAGALLVVVPGENHLVELRSHLAEEADSFETKAEEAVALCVPEFALKKRRSLVYEVLLHKEQLSDVIQMTPLFWHSSQQAKDAVGMLTELNVTVSFVLQTFGLSG